MTDETLPPIAPRRGPGRPPKLANAMPQELTADASPEEAHEAAQHARRVRAARKPFGSLQQKLAYPMRPGYHRHWFNDEPGRIQMAKEAGYEQVKDHDEKVVCRPVGTGRDGGVLMGYLMEIPLELWQEDMALVQERANLVDRDIKRRKIDAGAGLSKEDQGSFYVPTDRPGYLTHGR
jgi:hypothetical protein